MYRKNSSDRPNYNMVAPPSNLNQRQKRVDINQLPAQKYGKQQQAKFEKKRVIRDEDEDYFNDDEEELNQQPKYNETAAETTKATTNQEQVDDDDEIDPLDAFMEGLQKEVKNSQKNTSASAKKKVTQLNKKDLKGVRDDIDQEDIEESYYKYMEENPNAGLISSLDEENEDEILDYDLDGNPIYKKVKYIDPLPSIDHTQINYPPFSKNFYIEHEDMIRLDYMRIKDLRAKLNVKVLGVKPPKPVSSFAHFNFDEQLMKIIRKCEYTQPTPIQAQGVPVVLSGRDLIGIAKTGSGKTAAFIWPMLIHIMDQSDLKQGDGPIGLILAPTRELSQQIYTETKKFAKAYNIRAVCAYGGGNKWEQQKDLEEGAEIVIATPGRLIDLVKCKSTNLNKVSMLVLDEADRMFAMGFEAQVRSICDHCRPDKQTLMFSATFKKRIERLAIDVLNDPIKIIQGELGEANQDVNQRVLVFPIGTAKWEWLISKLTEFTSQGSVLIFVTQKTNAEELGSNLKARDFELEIIHGDFDQLSRNKVITKFKKKEVNILIATDIAARGLDIPHIRTVINYDVARDIDTHTHRIGRTGRAGVEGVAYTLIIAEKDKEFAGHLVRNLEGANQEVPDELMKLAMQSQWFKKARYKDSQAKKLNFKAGLGFKPDTTANKSSSNNNNNNSSTGSSSFNYHQTMNTSSYGSNSSQSSSASKNRLEAMRSAYAAQFKNAFRPATESSTSSISNLEDNNSTTTNNESLSNNFEKPKKKSRWQ